MRKKLQSRFIRTTTYITGLQQRKVLLVSFHLIRDRFPWLAIQRGSRWHRPLAWAQPSRLRY